MHNNENSYSWLLFMFHYECVFLQANGPDVPGVEGALTFSPVGHPNVNLSFQFGPHGATVKADKDTLDDIAVEVKQKPVTGSIKEVDVIFFTVKP